jgi:predicted GH43/DUF377 family glycosyl hydrolase
MAGKFQKVCGFTRGRVPCRLQSTPGVGRSADTARVGACATLALLLTGCGGYADFTLPILPPSAPVQFSFDAQPDPVIARGAPGEWDSHDALNPSVVQRNGAYFNLYSGFDGATWRTGLALSDDGGRWRKQGKILSPDPRTWEGNYWATNGSALFRHGEFFYWYQAGPAQTPRIGLARSRDGREWSKLAEPVLDLGPRGSWDERGVADPYVIDMGGRLFMFYLGQDRAHRQRLGLARSRDGVHWQKLRTNPIIELGDAGAFDEIGLGEPAVWQSHGWYWMLYTGRDRHENRRLGLARSRDGVHWERQGAPIAGGAAWDNKVICDPTVEVDGGRIRVWFGGGNVAHPVENVNGQIGAAVLTPAGATLKQ